MRHTWISSALALLFLIVAAGQQPARAQADPRSGVWILNVEKSKANSAQPPKSQWRIHQQKDDLFIVSVQGIAADGSQTAYAYTYRLDGKDYPMTGAKIPYGAETVTVKQIDPNTFDITTKKAGIALVTTRSVISEDGKVLTMTSKGTDAAGRPVSNVTVYDKRP